MPKHEAEHSKLELVFDALEIHEGYKNILLVKWLDL